MHKKISNTLKILIFLPLFIYTGERSFIAYDEGFYILQAKWILDKGNWIAPMWFDNISLDRTIGIQFIIALSQKFFGYNNFAIYIPITFCAITMAYLTYQIHKELLDNRYSLISPLILSTSFLWINYSNLATQDIVYSTIITLGIYSTIKASKSGENIFLILSGGWIGLAFMLKTFLTIIPLLGILPFLIYKKITFKKLFWVGFLIGFLPFIIWSLLILRAYGYSIYDNLFEKFLSLSTTNTFTNPFYFYLWNIPINIFPWSLFLISGLIFSSKIGNKTSKYFLFFYPILILSLLSIFSTKTPYYSLQIFSIFSINCYLGIALILQYKSKLLNILKFFNFILIPIIFFIAVIFVSFNSVYLDIDLIEKKLILFGVFLFSISWLSFNFVKSNKAKLVCVLLGPYLLFSTILQSGLITDRSKDLRIALEEMIVSENLEGVEIHTVTSDINNEIAHSKIIKILTILPKLGNGVKTLNDLENKEFAWTTIGSEIINAENEFQLINNSDIFAPWNLVKKEN